MKAFLSATDPKEGLKAAFTALMTSGKPAVEAALTKLVSRLSKVSLVKQDLGVHFTHVEGLFAPSKT